MVRGKSGRGHSCLQEEGEGKGEPFTTNQLWKVFDKASEEHPALADAGGMGCARTR